MFVNNEMKITVFNDGPIEVAGPLTVLNEDGAVVAKYEEGEMIYFCRCGQSKDKPFCDGSHDDCKFKHKVVTKGK